VAPGRRRVLFVGDSFTMGVGVGDEATYPAQVQRVDPRLEAVNMGMGAYGVGQAFLWYRRDGELLEAHAVVFAFIAHDFVRMTRDYYMAPKPVLRAREGVLVVENQPVPVRDVGERLREAARIFGYTLDLGKAIGALARRAGARADQADDAPPLETAELLFAELRHLAAARGQVLLLAYLPTAHDLARPERESWARGFARRWAAAHDVDFADLTPVLAGVPMDLRERLFLRDGHYSEAGNAWVARSLARRLATMLALPPALPVSSVPPPPGG
jgi:hypothetical protein